MSKKRTRARKKSQVEKRPVDKKAMVKNILRLLVLVAVTLAVYLIYQLLVNKYFYPVMITYMTLAAASILSYVIYNRGFSRRGLTPEMLPDTMSQEEKEEFIEDGARRLRRSRPLLIVVFAFAFTFIMDVFELIILPLFKGIFGI